MTELPEKKKVELNEKKRQEVIENIKKHGGEKILNCYQCGTCSSSCPSARISPYRIRTILENALEGNDEVKDEIWLCTTCHTCTERCPRGAEPSEVVYALRRIAVEKGRMLEAHKRVAKNVLTTGHAVPINDDIKKKRKELGLPEVPPTTHKYPEKLAEIKKIMEETKFPQV